MRNDLFTDSPRIVKDFFFLAALDCRDNLSCGWVFSRLQFGVNQFSVQGDFKASATTGNEGESFNICFIFA